MFRFEGVVVGPSREVRVRLRTVTNNYQHYSLESRIRIRLIIKEPKTSNYYGSFSRLDMFYEATAATAAEAPETLGYGPALKSHKSGLVTAVLIGFDSALGLFRLGNTIVLPAVVLASCLRVLYLVPNANIGALIVLWCLLVAAVEISIISTGRH